MRMSACPVRTWIAGSLAVGAALVLGACRAPAVVGAAQQARVDEVLHGADTEGAISLYLGTAPKTCVGASATTRLCEWILVNRRRAYAPLSDAIGSSDRIGVLCELPKDESPRAPGSCTAHPRRSNRYASTWESPEEREPAGGTPAPVSAAPPFALAGQEIERARTLVELSRLMGTAPLACAPTARAGQQRCVWQLSNTTYGHGTVAAWMQAPKRKQLELRCVLPTDGGPRSFESCSGDLP